MILTSGISLIFVKWMSHLYVVNLHATIWQVESLNAEKTALTQQPQNAATMLAQEKKMALCEVCGSFLVANDAVERTQSHITGKQHIGYGLIRDFLAEYKVWTCLCFQRFSC